MEIQCKSRTEVSLNFWIPFRKHQRQRGEERGTQGGISNSTGKKVTIGNWRERGKLWPKSRRDTKNQESQLWCRHSLCQNGRLEPRVQYNRLTASIGRGPSSHWALSFPLSPTLQSLIRSLVYQKRRLSPTGVKLSGKKSKSVFDFLTYSGETWFSFSCAEVVGVSRANGASNEIDRVSKFNNSLSFCAKQNAPRQIFFALWFFKDLIV